MRYSTDSSDVGARLLVQHYRVHLEVESEDPLWGPSSVEWIREKFITVKILEKDKMSLRFSALPSGPIVLGRGDTVRPPPGGPAET